MYTAEVVINANLIFNYLYVRDTCNQPVDLIIGFGHFDMRIPRLTGQLYEEGYAGKILLTGGTGAGTADLKEAEGIAFRNELVRTYPDIPQSRIIVESNSTNTKENIVFSDRILYEKNGKMNFSKGIQSVIAIASPYRQRRVYLTLKKVFPDIKVFNIPPDTSFETEIKLFKRKSQDIIQLIVGEMERIINYPDKGYIAFEEIPSEIYNAYKTTKRIAKFK